jgi:hypothetical protein
LKEELAVNEINIWQITYFFIKFVRLESYYQQIVNKMC